MPRQESISACLAWAGSASNYEITSDDHDQHKANKRDDVRFSPVLIVM